MGFDDELATVAHGLRGASVGENAVERLGVCHRMMVQDSLLESQGFLRVSFSDPPKALGG